MYAVLHFLKEIYPTFHNYLSSEIDGDGNMEVQWPSFSLKITKKYVMILWQA